MYKKYRRLFQTAVPAALVAALVSGLVSPPAFAESSEPDPAAQSEPDVLALSAGSVVPEVEDDPEIPEGDFTEVEPPAFNAPPGVSADPTTGLFPEGEDIAGDDQIEPAQPIGADDLASFDPAELSDADITEREAYQETYALDDGTNVSKVSLEPLNVEDADGDWVPVETDIDTVGPLAWLGIGGGEVENHPLEPTFSESASDRGLLTLTNDENTIGFTLREAADSKIVRNAETGPDARSHIEYLDVFAGVDLTYDVTPGAVKENLRINDRPDSDGPLRWTWDVEASGLTLSKDVQNSISFVDSSGSVIFVMPAPVMTDSAYIEGVRTDAMATVETTLLRVGTDGWRIVVSPDRAWINDPERVYPILIDPSVSDPINNEHINAYKSQNGQLTSPVLTDSVRVGNSNNGGIWRTVVYYDYTPFFGKQIIMAQIATSSPFGQSSTDARWGAVHNATNFQFESLGDTLAGLEIGPDGGATEGGLNASNTAPAEPRLSQQIADWVNSGSPGHHLALRGDETANTFTYKNINTAMFIQWKDYSNPGVYPVPSNNATRVSMTPEIAATGRSDASGLGGLESQVHLTASNGTLLWYSSWTTDDRVTVPRNILAPNTTYRWKQFVRDKFNGWLNTDNSRATGLFTFTTVAAVIPRESTANIARDEVVTSLTPKLTTESVTSQIGQPVKYLFRVATGSDSLTGTIATSGWLSSPSWTLPTGVLQDGGSYSWSVSTKDDVGPYGPTWSRPFKVNLRIGSPGPSPTDVAGPVTVNLANGNANLTFTSPMVQTAGGPMGMSFAYNSLKPDDTGLTATYFDASEQPGAVTWKDAPTDDPDLMKQVLVRNDATADFSWGTGSPGPSVPSDKFLAVWKGFIRPPAGEWAFAAMADDSYRIRVGAGTGMAETNRWSGYALNKRDYGPTFSSDGNAAQFELRYGENSGSAYVTVWAKNKSQACAASPVPEGCEFIVPSTWFSTKPGTLPAGWSASTPVAGPAGAYAGVEVKDSSILLTDSAGGVHAYTKKSSGGYEPPRGEYGVMALESGTSGAAPFNKVTFTDEAGITYFFNSAGKIEFTRNPLDVRKPMAPISSYRALTGQIDAISDALSAKVVSGTTTYERQVRFVYEADLASAVGLSSSDTDGDALACRTPTGGNMSDPPKGALCRIVYPGHVPGAKDTTEIFYNALGQIARIVDPGDQITSFEYNSAGLMSLVRDSLANDWENNVNAAEPAATSGTTIGYTSTTKKVASVYLPAPDGKTVTAQPKKTYTYSTTEKETYVGLVGLEVPLGGPTSGKYRKVTFDSSFRGLTDTVATGMPTDTVGSGITAAQVWNGKDMRLSSTDASGLMTTTLYNAQDRPVETYGPAPSECFDPTTRRPLPSCPETVGHTTTAYDETLVGLRMAFYENEATAGAPAAYGLGIGGTGGAVDRNWGTSAPISGLKADGWSMQLTGLVNFPSQGDYYFEADVDDGMQLWVDNNLLINNRVYQSLHGTGRGYVKVESDRTSVPIRLTYFDHTGGAELHLYYATSPGGQRYPVPGSWLTPDYGLTTSSQMDDSSPAGLPAISGISSTTEYGASPWLGLPQTTTVDPGGPTPLVSSTDYETSSVQYNRPLKTWSPSALAAAATTSTTGNAYYDPMETIAQGGGVGSCSIPNTTKQYGMLQTVRSANANSAIGIGADVRTNYAYDLLGRVVGTKSTGDSVTSCTTYDIRGRVVQSTDSGASNALRTVVTQYTSDGTPTGDPRVGSVTEALPSPYAALSNGKTTVVKDLLGRVTSSTDVWGTVTTNTYNRFSQLTKTTIAAVGSTSVSDFTYTINGSLASVRDNGAPVATLAYDESGLLAVVQYPSASGGVGNGTSLAISRDGAGQTSGLEWTLADGIVSDNVLRSQSGRILRDAILNGQTYTSTYTYDSLGRMVKAAIPGHTLSYQFGDNGCGATTSGRNGNRTSVSDVPTSSQTPTYTTSYCYDIDDRLVAATEVATNSSNALASRTRPVNTVPAGNITYDAHGNVRTMNDQTFTYDASDRHIRTTTSGGTSVTYLRGVGGEIIARIDTAGTVIRYSGNLVLDATGAIQRNLSLPGGASVSISIASNARTWSYPNVHGDVTWTADNSGNKSGFYLYDPFGSPMDVTSKIFASATTNDLVPDTQPGELDLGWVGSNGKQYEHESTIAVVEMGVRMYSAWLGRFLAQDPVRGGNSSAYNYPNDPINMFDLDGKKQDCGKCTYAQTMGGIAAGNDGAGKSAQAAGYVAAGVTMGTSTWHGKQAAMNAIKAPVSPQDMAAMYSGISLAFTVASITVPSLGIVASATSAVAASYDCQIAHNEANCAMDQIGIALSFAPFASLKVARLANADRRLERGMASVGGAIATMSDGFGASMYIGGQVGDAIH